MSFIGTPDILCDIKECSTLVPTYWWRGMLGMVGVIAFVCGPHRDEMLEGGHLTADEFVYGRLVGRNHWRPDPVPV